MRNDETLRKKITLKEGQYTLVESEPEDKDENKLQTEERYRVFFENAVEAMLVLQGGYVKLCNKKAETLIGYSQKEMSTLLFTTFIHPEYKEMVLKNHLKSLVGEPRESTYRFKLLRKDETERWVEFKEIKIIFEGKPGTFNFLSDITERKQAEDRLFHLGYVDPLTGLHNMRFYEEALAKISLSGNLPLSLIMADVNHLQATNDRFGRKIGDQLLTEMALIIKNACRSDDVPARIGGNRFGILLPGTDSGAAQKVVNRLREAVEKTQIAEAALSASFGWATKTSPEEDLETLTAQAERMMAQG